MYRSLIFSILLLASAQVATAQRSDRCGTYGDRPEALMNRLARYLVDDNYEQFRAGKFDQVPATAPRSVVTDSRLCQRIMHTVERELRARDESREAPQLGYDFRIFRYGNYYAVLVVTNDAPGQTGLGYASFFVVRPSDLEIVGKILV